MYYHGMTFSHWYYWDRACETVSYPSLHVNISNLVFNTYIMYIRTKLDYIVVYEIGL